MIPKKDLRFEFMRGTGPGGQHRNKTASACRVTHVPTGITAYSDERSQHVSRRKALAELESRIVNKRLQKVAASKKQRRDRVIHDCPTIRTYDFKSMIVKDHRTGKKASLKAVLDEGRIELLR